MRFLAKDDSTLDAAFREAVERSLLSKCSVAKSGAAIVSEGRVVAVGTNGAYGGFSCYQPCDASCRVWPTAIEQAIENAMRQGRRLAGVSVILAASDVRTAMPSQETISYLENEGVREVIVKRGARFVGYAPNDLRAFARRQEYIGNS